MRPILITAKLLCRENTQTHKYLLIIPECNLISAKNDSKCTVTIMFNILPSELWFLDPRLQSI